MIRALAAYRRPGSPMYDRHFLSLPADIVRRENVPGLIDILHDEALPAMVREHAAGALGEIGDRRATEFLIDALDVVCIRRGVCVALGRLKAHEAAERLAPLALRVKAARWALSQLDVAQTTEQTLDDLRTGHLRLIKTKIARLDAPQTRDVTRRILQAFGDVLARGSLGPEHCWMITSLQHLAPRMDERAEREAGDLLIRALGQSVHTAEGVRHRLILAMRALAPAEAIPALVEFIGQVDYPVHRQGAAVCIDAILRARGGDAHALLLQQEDILRGILDRVEREVAAAEPAEPRVPWDMRRGTPKWTAAGERAIGAIERLLERCEPMGSG